jgi:hypothetical protein
LILKSKKIYLYKKLQAKEARSPEIKKRHPKRAASVGPKPNGVIN